MMSPIGTALTTREERFWCRSTNLAQAYNRERNAPRIASFIDHVLGNRFGHRPKARASILEPSRHVEPSDLRTPLSKRVDRVPVLYFTDASRETITWVIQSMLDQWNMSLAELETTSSHNLAAALTTCRKSIPVAASSLEVPLVPSFLRSVAV
jgi:hypothetical protein